MKVILVNEKGRVMEFSAGPYGPAVEQVIRRNCPNVPVFSEVLLNTQEGRAVLGSDDKPITLSIRNGYVTRQFQPGLGGVMTYVLPDVRMEALCGAFRQLFPAEFHLVETGVIQKSNTINI